MSSTSSGQLQLDPLPPESWGRRFRRAREDHARLSLQAAEAAVKELGWETSHTTLGRIEKANEVPATKRQRQTAIFALVAYGVDPTDFGLSLNELPDTLNRRLTWIAGRAA